MSSSASAATSWSKRYSAARCSLRRAKYCRDPVGRRSISVESTCLSAAHQDQATLHLGIHGHPPDHAAPPRCLHNTTLRTEECRRWTRQGCRWRQWPTCSLRLQRPPHRGVEHNIVCPSSELHVTAPLCSRSLHQRPSTTVTATSAPAYLIVRICHFRRHAPSATARPAVHGTAATSSITHARLFLIHVALQPTHCLRTHRAHSFCTLPN